MNSYLFSFSIISGDQGAILTTFLVFPIRRYHFISLYVCIYIYFIIWIIVKDLSKISSIFRHDTSEWLKSRIDIAYFLLLLVSSNRWPNKIIKDNNTISFQDYFWIMFKLVTE